MDVVTDLTMASAGRSGSRVRRPVNRTLFIGPGLLLGRPAAPVPTLRLRRVDPGGRRVPTGRRTVAGGTHPAVGCDFTAASPVLGTRKTGASARCRFVPDG